jgi:hypothetical protein
MEAVGPSVYDVGGPSIARLVEGLRNGCANEGNSPPFYGCFGRSPLGERFFGSIRATILTKSDALFLGQQ